MKISNNELKVAATVSKYMCEDLFKIDPVRYREATKQGIPHGDLAYGAALADWIKKGKPTNAWFSYAPGQIECKLLLAFKVELSAKFGLEILSIEDGEERRKKEVKVKTKKVFDWGIN